MNTAGYVLIVEDDEAVRTGLRELFEAAGYHVTEAANGHAAITALQQDPLPHVIVLDIEMPGMNGVAFRLRQLKDVRTADVPVIVHSFVPASEVITGILQASAYLTKPADADTLLQTVRRVLG